MVNRIRVDDNDLQTHMDYVGQIIDPWIHNLELINDKLVEADRVVDDSEVRSVLSFVYNDLQNELDSLRLKSEAVGQNNLYKLHEEVIENIDVPFYKDIELVLSNIASTSINDHLVDVDGFGVLVNDFENDLASGPSTNTTEIRKKNSINFMDLMKSPLSREMKKAQYEAMLPFSELA
ncbi:MAG: hypothetical protein ACK5LC_08795, partial [Coprobacillaceae bacterium]